MTYIAREFSPSELHDEEILEDPRIDGDLEDLEEHRNTCEHDDCICRGVSGKPERGDEVRAGTSKGMIASRESGGMVNVKWGEYWTQGYPIDRFIACGDYWEVAGA